MEDTQQPADDELAASLMLSLQHFSQPSSFSQPPPHHHPQQLPHALQTQFAAPDGLMASTLEGPEQDVQSPPQQQQPQEQETQEPQQPPQPFRRRLISSPMELPQLSVSYKQVRRSSIGFISDLPPDTSSAPGDGQSVGTRKRKAPSATVILGGASSGSSKKNTKKPSASSSSKRNAAKDVAADEDADEEIEPSEPKRPRLLVNKWTSKTIPEEKKLRIDQIWINKLDMSPEAAKGIFEKSSLAYSLSEQLITQKIDYFLSQGISKQILVEVTIRYPQLYNFSLENTIIPNIEFIKSLGVDLSLFMTKSHLLLGQNPETKLKPNVAYFRQLGMKEERIMKLLVEIPMAFCMNLESKLRPTIAYMKEYFGMTDDEIPRFLEVHPQMFGYNLENNLKPKVEFLVKHQVAKPPLKQFFMRNYTLLSFSLAKRIKPRTAFLLSIGRGVKIANLQLAEKKFHQQFPLFAEFLLTYDESQHFK